MNLTVKTLYNNSIYGIKCRSCNLTYIGQTKRNFKVRYKEHVTDFKYNRKKISFAKHLIETGHELGNISDTLMILKPNVYNLSINTAEVFYINKFLKKYNQILNENLINRTNPLFHINTHKIVPARSNTI